MHDTPEQQRTNPRGPDAPRDSCKRLPQMSAIIERAGSSVSQLLSALPAVGRVELAVLLYPFS
jgi:hypothetical protein